MSCRPTMFMVAWQRLVLLGPHRIDAAAGPRLVVARDGLARASAQGGRHDLRADGDLHAHRRPDRSARPSAGAAIDPDTARRYALAAPLALGFIVSLLLALRVSYGLAATAVDVPFSPRLSWAYSRGNAWPIIGALFVVYFGGAFVTAVAALLTARHDARRAAAPTRPPLWSSWTVAILVSYGVTALTATVQAVIFRRLFAWREGVGCRPVSALLAIARCR